MPFRTLPLPLPKIREGSLGPSLFSIDIPLLRSWVSRLRNFASSKRTLYLAAMLVIARVKSFPSDHGQRYSLCKERSLKSYRKL